MKGRDDVKALPVLFATGRTSTGSGSTRRRGVLESYFQIWPAPLTVVFAIRQSIAASRGVPKLGVRMPADRRAAELLQTLGPVTGTSVNRSGSPPLDNPDAVEALFRREIDWLVDGGKTPGGKALDGRRRDADAARRAARGRVRLGAPVSLRRASRAPC